MWSAFVAAQPSVSPMPEHRAPSGKVLGREFYYDSAGRTILGNTITDQMGGGGSEPFECPAIILFGDAVTASKTKCGHTPFGGDDEHQPGTSGHYYLVKDLDCDTSLFFWNTEVNLLTRWLLLTGLGSSSACQNSDNDYTRTIDSVTCAETVDPIDASFVEHEVLSVEYTTALLTSNTQGALPTYDDDFNDATSAIRDLDGDELNLTIQRFKPKFTFAAQATGFTIGYNEHFVPDVGSPTDTPRTVAVGMGDTEAIGDEVLEPATNGTITITDIDCV